MRPPTASAPASQSCSSRLASCATATDPLVAVCVVPVRGGCGCVPGLDPGVRCREGDEGAGPAVSAAKCVEARR
eukprot:3576773-Rhodomonas_salina.3